MPMRQTAGSGGGGGAIFVDSAKIGAEAGRA